MAEASLVVYHSCTKSSSHVPTTSTTSVIAAARCMAGLAMLVTKPSTKTCTRPAKSARKRRFISKVWEWVKSFVTDAKTRCQGVADFYYTSVSLFGHSNFMTVSPSWCQFACAETYGDPNTVLVRK